MKIHARMISLILAMFLCLSMLPVGAWAEEIPATNLLENILLPVENTVLEEESVEESPAESEDYVATESLPLEEQPAEVELSSEEETVVEEIPSLDGETVASGTCGDDLTWTLDDAGLLTISGTGDMYDYGYYSPVPWEEAAIKEIVVADGVTSIGDCAFEYCRALEEITIPASLSYIGCTAFRCCGSFLIIYEGTQEEMLKMELSHGNENFLMVLDVPETASGVCGDNLVWDLTDGTLTISGTGAMEDWTAGRKPSWYIYTKHIERINIESGVTTIGSHAFMGANLTEIGSYPNLTEISIADTVTSVGDWAFDSCYALEKVTMLASAVTFGSNIFNGCAGLKSAGPIGSGCNYEFGWTEAIPANAFCSCNGLTSVIIPEGITTIGSSAFNNTPLTSVVFPEGVTTIEDYAFLNCYSLTSVTIPVSIQRIGSSVFSSTEKLSEVYYSGTQEQWDAIEIAGGNDYLCSLMQSLTGTCGENLVWTLADGVLTISGEGSMDSWHTAEEVPWANMKRLIEEVDIGEGVTTIGGYAFSNCDKLTEVEIPDGVISIGGNVFKNCDGLTSIALPESVTWIGQSAFERCRYLVSVELPNSITVIERRAFACCERLAEIEIPEGVTAIGDGVFVNCSSLRSVILPVSIEEIGEEAFYNCPVLAEVSYDGTSDQWFSVAVAIGNDELVQVMDLTPAGSCGEGVRWELTEGILTISGEGDMNSWTIDLLAPWYYFRDQIKTVVIGNGITAIGSYAFRGCTELVSITIPNSVLCIYENSCYECSGLAEVKYDGTSEEWYSIIFTTGNERLVQLAAIPGAPVVASGTWGDGVLWTFYMDGLLEVLGTGVIDKNVNVPSGSVTSVYIGDGITQIDSCTFEFYENLNCVRIPTTVTEIGSRAFNYCPLQEVIYEGTREEWYSILIAQSNDSLVAAAPYPAPTEGCCGDDLLWKVEDGVLFIEGAGNMYDWSYTYRAPWHYVRESITALKLDSGVTSIGDYAFFDLSMLVETELPDSLTSIGDDAFYGCYNLIYINIPEGVASIGVRAFYDCGLHQITIPESVTAIGGDAFYGAQFTTAGSIGSGCDYEFGWTEQIPNYAFERCSKLTSVNLPESITSIGTWAFAYCSSLISLTIPDGVTSIGSNAFSHCTNLNGIIIPDGVTSIDSGTFSGCTSLSGITIPDDVTAIGSSAFYGCTSLTSIIIPDGVTSIGKLAFSDCTGLVSVDVPKSVTTIADMAFSDCSSLAEVSYPGNAADWYSINFGSNNEALIEAAGFEVPDSGVCGDDLVWDLTEGTLTISGSGAMPDWTDTRPVWYYSRDEIVDVVIEDGVTHIGSYAFYVCSSITSVTIPDSVTSMGELAFHGCSALTSVTIPGSVEAIPNSAFGSCSALTKVVINEGPTSIGNSAFACCTSLTSVTIPGTVKEIGASAFACCTALEAIVIPEGVETLGIMDFEGEVRESEAGVFVECSALTKITLPVSLQVIGVACFHDTSELSTVVYNGEEEDWKRIHISYLNEYLLAAVDYPAAGYCGENLSWEIDGNTLYISGYGDMNTYTATSNPWRNYATVIESIVLEEGITSVSEGAFYSLREAVSVSLPVSINTIAESAFGDYRADGISIETVSYAGTEDDWYAIDIGDVNGSLWRGMGYAEPRSGTHAGNIQWNVYKNVLTISGYGEMASFGGVAPWMYAAPYVHTIVVEEGVKSIAARAFYRKIEVDSVLQELPYVSFERVESVDLPEGLVSIGSYAFAWCTGLTDITIPDSVEYVATTAFLGCTGLKQISKADGTIIQITAGDNNLDGVIDTDDAQEALDIASGVSTIADSGDAAEMVSSSLASDVNADGVVDSRDATQILRYTNGLESTLS